jgi:hypothetical protein
MRHWPSRSAVVRIAVAVFPCLFACNTQPGTALAEGPPLRAAVMATYLVKFAPFVDWPPSSFASASAPLVICIVGEALGGAADQAAAGQADDQHPVVVRHIAMARADSPCHILFTEGMPQQSVGEALAAVGGKPVLTVTDQPESATRKGIINFLVKDNHVRFEIDQEQAVQAGLRLSSQLLALAVNMRR